MLTLYRGSTFLDFRAISCPPQLPVKNISAATLACLCGVANVLRLQSGGSLSSIDTSTPKILEPIRRQLGVAHRVLDILVAEIGLQGSGIVALVRQGKAAGMAQHVRMSFEAELGSFSSALHHPCKACRREGRRSF